MKKKMLKMLAFFGASAAFASYGVAEEAMGAVFSARGSETQRVTIGGYIQSGYQWVDLDDDNAKAKDPNHYNNFLLSHARLYVKAELQGGWSGVMDIDFAGQPGQTYSTVFDTDRASGSTRDSRGGFELTSSNNCSDQCKIYLDKAYIQKSYCDATFRFGYMKVTWGAENLTPEPHLKTVERSLANNYFMQVGRRVNGGNHLSDSDAPTWLWVGNKFGDRHNGIQAAGEVANFHWSASLTNGYQGQCFNSTKFNNDLGFYASLAYEFDVCNADLLVGINFGTQAKGSSEVGSPRRNVWGVNPYILANYDRFSFLGELFWTSVQMGSAVKDKGDASPIGVTLLPSFMLNDKWEFVGRFSYVNTDKSGMTIHNSFGCAPDDGVFTGTTTGTKLASNTIFEKAYAGYLGVNYHFSSAVKFLLGLEQAHYKNRLMGPGIGANASFSGVGSDVSAKVNAVRAALQLVF